MIRPEIDADLESVRQVLCAAFPTPAEADLVDLLRANGNLLVSHVGLVKSRVVGHVAFSPVSIENVGLSGAGLAPLAVHPDHQRHGLGSQLTREGLDACRLAGIDYVVVLGHTDYYQRFGFAPAAQFGLQNEYGAGDEFMAIELTEHCLAEVTGLVCYGSEFGAFS